MEVLNSAAAAASVCPPAGMFGPRPSMATYQEERREVFESILESLAAAEPDADCRAACGRLLRHLAESGRRSLA